ncbi:MAG: acyl-CoA dehydrogenase, partial [Alphaproteobacteria bacterium]
MPLKYSAPLKDIGFALEAAGASDSRYDDVPNIEVLRPDDKGEVMGMQMLESAGAFAQEELLPLYNKPSKANYEDGDHKVVLPDGYERAYKEYVNLGLQSISAAEKDEGMELPRALDAAATQILYAGNNSFTIIRALTKSVYEGIKHNAKDAEPGNAEGKLSSAQRDIMLKKLASGQWSGVMSMTEPNAGSDLSNLTTRADLQGDGSYKVNGTKIFITAGDNEFSTRDKDGNIIHLVLTKIAGDKGISLMAIPKFAINDDGSLGEKNGVYVSGIEHKTGMHDSATTTMQYEDAKGWLVGEREHGLAAMFDVMNEARRAVGRQSLGIADVAAQNALDYARHKDEGRRMGRAAHGPEEGSKEADLIAVHPPVRDMLLKNRAFVEGARVLDLMTELEADKAAQGDKEAQQWVQLTTNMIKYHFTEEGDRTADRATQIFGGSGFISETGIGQLAQDNRVTRIYEGTNQIQAVALVGRQLPNMQIFEKRVTEFLDTTELGEKYTAPLREGLEELLKATQHMQTLAKEDKNSLNAAAEGFVDLFAKVAVGYAWARSAELAQSRLQPTVQPHEKLFLETKLATANFYMQRVLMPHIKGQHTVIGAGIETLAMPDLEIRRQDVKPVKQLAAIPLRELVKKLGDRGLPDANAVAQARVDRVNHIADTMPEAEKRDIERTAAEVKADLGDARNGDPVAEAVKTRVRALQQKRAV